MSTEKTKNILQYWSQAITRTKIMSTWWSEKAKYYIPELEDFTVYSLLQINMSTITQSNILNLIGRELGNIM